MGYVRKSGQELTKEEKKWVKDFQKLLDRCPSNRLGFYTIGDPTLCLYNRDYSDQIEEENDDLINILNREGWGFEETLDFPNPVEGVCG